MSKFMKMLLADVDRFIGFNLLKFILRKIKEF